jgi:hypothetical protein
MRVSPILVAVALIVAITPCAARVGGTGLKGTVEPQTGLRIGLASCELWNDGTIYFLSRVSNQATPYSSDRVFMRATFYDRAGRRLFMQLVNVGDGAGWGTTPLVGPYATMRAHIARMACAIDSRMTNDPPNGGFVAYGNASAEACRKPILNEVDGGPIVTLRSIAFGDDWVSLGLSASINNFIPVYHDTFDRSPFFMKVDSEKATVVRVTGQDPQRLTLTQTGLSAGHHSILYGEGSGEEATTWAFCFHN